MSESNTLKSIQLPFVLRRASLMMGCIFMIAFLASIILQTNHTDVYTAEQTQSNICTSRELEKILRQNDETNFLLSLVGMVLAIGITNLIKGFDALIRHRPEKTPPSSRWSMRALWGFALLVLIIQLIWGMRLALDLTSNFGFFIYYVSLSIIVYGMIVYIFPDNLNEVFEKEKNACNLYWSPEILIRLCGFYVLLAVYLASTIPMSVVFLYGCPETPLMIVLTYTGISAKVLCLLAIWRALHVKKGIWNLLIDEHNNRKSDIIDEPNAQSVIGRLDYAIIILSLLVSIIYIVLRIKPCF